MVIKKRFWNFIKKNKAVSLIILAFVLILLIILGLKLYIYFQFLLGNILTVRLDTSKTDIYLNNNQNETIEFSFAAFASPFCKVKCSSYFLDISTNTTLDADNFSLGSISKIKKETVFTGIGKGQNLYRFSLSCHNIKSMFCDTNEEIFTRESLVNVNYDLNSSEKELRETLLKDILDLENKIFILNATYFHFLNSTSEINNSFSIKISILNLSNLSLFETKEDFQNFHFSEANMSLNQVKLLFNASNESVFSSINTILTNVSTYNDLIDNVSLLKNNIKILGQGIDPNQTSEFENIVNDFNNKTSLFVSTLDLGEKSVIVDSILKINTTQINSGVYVPAFNLSFNLSRLILSLPNFENLSLNNSMSIVNIPEKCCVYSVCGNCTSKDENYPIIFVHGHDFDKSVSAEYSLNTFAHVQSQLESLYLDSGEITLYTTHSNVSGLLGNFNVPVSFRVTYYFDAFKNGSAYIPVTAKAENIDTYALRLKTLIDNAKYESGKSKVIIVAHSMGGLVSRRYIQIFGGGSVDKLILIGVPNHGVEGKVKTLCGLLGADRECLDLSSGSLLLSKLNNDYSDPVKTYSIIGMGCDMNGEDGDGIVTSESAKLKGSEEYFVSGNCSGVDYLHSKLLGKDYPQVIDIIKNIVKN